MISVQTDLFMLVDSKRVNSRSIRKEIGKVNAGVDRYESMLVKDTYNSEDPPEFMDEVADTGEEAFLENARRTAFKMSELRRERSYLEKKIGIYSRFANDLIRKIDHAESRVVVAGVNSDGHSPEYFLPSEEYSLGCIYKEMIDSENVQDSDNESIFFLLEE